MDVINRAVRQSRKSQRGFTLIELLVVIAVLAILAAIVIFNITGVKDRGNKSACATDLKSVQSAIDAYMSDHPGTSIPTGAVPATGGVWGLLVPAYLHAPSNPSECNSATPLTIAQANGTDGTEGYTVTGQ